MAKQTATGKDPIELRTAREVVDRAERIRLSERDSARVLKLLENPPKPTRALLAAASRRAAAVAVAQRERKKPGISQDAQSS